MKLRNYREIPILRWEDRGVENRHNPPEWCRGRKSREIPVRAVGHGEGKLHIALAGTFLDTPRGHGYNFHVFLEVKQ